MSSKSSRKARDARQGATKEERRLVTIADTAKRAENSQKGRRRRQKRRGPAPPYKGVVGRLTKPVLPQALHSWLESIEKPLNHQSKIPMNVNNITANHSTLVRTLVTDVGTVTANTCTEYMMFPGHATFQVVRPRNYQTPMVQASAVNYMPGPVSLAVNTPASIFKEGGIVIGGAVNVTTAMSHVPYDTAVPYPGQRVGAGLSETGWRMVSMGVKIVNRTVLLNRGGNVSTVCVDKEYTDTTQAAYRRFESFRDWGMDTMCCHEGRETHVDGVHEDQCEYCGAENPGWVTYIPQEIDISYWSSDQSAFTTDAAGAGMHWWLNSDATQGQSYVVYVVQNWEMTGETLRNITTVAVSHPLAADVVPPALNMVRNADPDASNVGKVAHIVAATRDTGFNGILHKALGLPAPASPYSVKHLHPWLGKIANVAHLVENLF